MEIEKLTITKTELFEAVQAYLKHRGVDVKVIGVEKKYSYSTVIDVDCEIRVRSEEEIPPTIPEVSALPNPATVAIEAGKELTHDAIH